MAKNQAYEIDMTDYVVPGTDHLIRTDETGNIVVVPGTENIPREDVNGNVIKGEYGTPEMGALYPMRRNIIDIFMSFPVTGRAIIEHRKLGDKIDEFEGDKLYLTDIEYKALVAPFEEYQFRPAVDGIMSERIFDAKKVDMEPAGKKK